MCFLYFLLFSWYGDHRDLHVMPPAFPTRRSSDLHEGVFSYLPGTTNDLGGALVADPRIKAVGFTGSRGGGLALMKIAAERKEPRSEEHTSELQSLMRISYAVFCLKQKRT